MTTSMSERSSVETGGRITFAWRVVSVTYMSTATHHSSVASASSRRAPPGVESTGLPAKISMPRTWPSPGVVISSARPATGSSPFISGSPLTRCVWRPWSPKPSSRARFSTAPTSNAGLGNIAPPGTSRLPVTALSTLMSQCVSEPVRCWQTPTRPYATARSASANSRASRSIVAASTPAIGAARATGQSAASASIVAIPSAWPSRWPSRVRPSANSTCSIPSSR